MEEMENVGLQSEDQAADDPGYEDQVAGEDSFEDSQEEEIDDTEAELTEDRDSEDLEEDPEEESDDEEAEDQPEESEETSDDVMIGNEIVTVSGNVIIFPEDFDYSMFQVNAEGEVGNYDDLAEMVEDQTTLIYGSSVVIIFLLGIIAGTLFVHGFRLRRV
ncbi:MAG: hypothetical protein J1F18_11365 [Lachnospiraceae bacterium]|nr:hypothetical protein [Lachnospiraceae bacterium]